MLTLGAWHITLFAIMFITTCIFMILVILIQKPRGGGLSGAFGGAGGSAQAAFGAKTGDVLTWFTVFCFTAFVLLGIGLTWSIKPTIQAATPTLMPVGASGNQPQQIPGQTDNAPDPSTTAVPESTPSPAAQTPQEASP